MGLRPHSEALHVVVSGSASPLAAVSAVAGQRVTVYRVIVSVASAVNVTFQDTGAGALSSALQFVGTTLQPLVIGDANNGDPLWQTGVGLGLQVALSGAVQTNVDIWYTQEVAF